jgi:NADH dehydrogenase [ubiquinone] 1 alpha subcomplex assembly factor 7
VTLNGGDRRDTPLGRILAKEIAATGPVGVEAYVHRCLTDPAHGYYTTRSGIGRDGDFTTAPEISQVFGELIGLWAAVAWQQMGAPAKFNLVELGPGRGVLLDDALRAARVLPGFLDAVDLHLCEINPAFRQLQADRLAAHNIKPTWHDGWPASVADVPTIIIANEFLDTIPGSLWQRGAEGDWSALAVGLDGRSRLTFVPQPGAPPFSAGDLPAADPAAIFTHTDFSDLARGLAATAASAPLAALFIDYGHTDTTWGDTLQAVRNHKPEHPLASPGEADLSFAVDFAAFFRACQSVALGCDGPVTQTEFLGQLGIAERASRLMSANPARANDIESGVYRLMASPGMGTRFQVAAIRSADLQPLPGFASKQP